MSDDVALFAGTQEGLFVLRPTGSGWEIANHVWPNAVLDSIAGCANTPERVFAGVAYDGVYRTDDAGRTWKRIFEGDIRALTVDPTDDDVVYCGTEPPHLYRSEDRGETWHEVIGLQKLPEEIKKRWWAPYPPATGHILTIFVHPDDPKIITCALEHGGIHRSLDRGESWEDVSGGIDYLDIHVIMTAPNRLDRWFVSSARGFFTTDDPAHGWARAENGFTRDYFHDFIFLAPDAPGKDPTMVIATADHSPGSWRRPEFARAAVFRSTNCAQSWERVTDGFEDEMKPMVWALRAHPTDPNAAFAGVGHVIRGPAEGPSGPGSIHVTRDRGATWRKISDVPGMRVIWASPTG
ncbi:MAG TPA: hypothetical protein VFC51_17215 [Chloroflexota bacterium]|nr:hypothetical protein [Chloroflexota bacterium]